VAPIGALLPLPIELSVDQRRRQRRWTVLLRAILAFPQLVVVAALGVAAYVVLIIGWFGALFTGRLPVWVHEYVTGYLRWVVRVYAYLGLLTDDYPPFSLESEPGYAVALAVPLPGPLNRLSVLFRIILAFPAYVLSSLVSIGLGFVLLVGWVAALVTGWLPQPIFGASAAILRYVVRVDGFFFMLTACYPRGLFGDPAVASGVWGPASSPAAWPAPVAPPPPAPAWGDTVPGHGLPVAPPPAAPSWSSPPPVGMSPGAPAPPSWPPPAAPGAPWPAPTPAGPPPAAPSWPAPVAPVWPAVGAPAASYAAVAPPPAAPARSWRIELSSGAKAVVVVAIILGALYYPLVEIPTFLGIQHTADTQTADAYVQLETAMIGFEQTAKGCESAAEPLQCQSSADLTAAQDFQSFNRTLQGIGYTGANVVLAARARTDASQVVDDLHDLASQTASIQQYEAALRSTTYVADLRRFQTDAEALLQGVS
jgi:hypothetical protein